MKKIPQSFQVSKIPKFTHTTLILKSLHWLQINEGIEYKILSLAFKLLFTTQPAYLYDLISLQTPRNTRSSPVVVTLARPPTRPAVRSWQTYHRPNQPHYRPSPRSP